MPSRVQITFTVEKPTHDGLVKRAQTMGYKVADFARMLFEAGYAARVKRERNLPADDAELDAAVRAVFCLAGELKPREIARATGLAPDTVDNILRGFAKVAGEARRPSSPSGGGRGAERSEAERGKADQDMDSPSPSPAATPLPPPEGEDRPASAYVRPAKVRTPSSFTPEDHVALRKAYSDGLSVGAIARLLNCTEGSLTAFIGGRRALFPRRKAG